MRRYLVSLLVTLFLLVFPVGKVLAVEDPKSTANNRFGVHIFDISEIDQVPELVNGEEGAWGYVTVIMREDQHDRDKWQEFMRKCQEKKLIPIVRLATRMTPIGWSKPGKFTTVDHANFLSDLDWPVQNRYVVIYNEPNHATEWGGVVNPEEYARELAKALRVFKTRHEDFFVLPAGLDAAAPNAPGYMNWQTYMQRMYYENPQALKNIDGWNSHSYPNPAFSGSPLDTHDHSIVSFKHETEFYERLTGKNLPVFITETGWSDLSLSDETVAHYFELAFSKAWNDEQVIAVTPFVIQAYDGPFKQFSLLSEGAKPKPQYDMLAGMSKIKGEPSVVSTRGDDSYVLGEKDNGEPSVVSTRGNDSYVLGDKDKNGQAFSQPESRWGEENWHKVWKWVEEAAGI
jgi:hypothetical protein